MGNILAIVGRPNVGKSTLFNRLTGSRQAIVDAASGVTRDRHYGRSDWNGIEFSVIDTGGYVTGSNDVFETEIRKQVELAIDEADAILFMVDVKDGLTPLDAEVADMLRKSEKKVFLVVNKVDNTERLQDVADFYRLGFDKLHPVSSVNGSGTGELLDEVAGLFKAGTVEEMAALPRYAVVGRPNVGKSSFINALIGKERNIVTPVPGTTRDTIYVHYHRYGFDFLLADTAGLRKKGKVHENVEFYSVLRSIRSIESSDVCMLMVDATQGFESQDLNIFRLIEKNNKGVVILVNKWDLIDKDTHTHRQFERSILEKTAPFTDVPVVFTSIPGKQRIHKALDLCHQVYRNKERKIPTSQLNELLLPVIRDNPPPVTKGKQIKIKYITQLKTKHPAFVFFCNLPQYVKDPYKRFLENKIRDHFEFTGVPVQIFVRNK